MYTNGFLTIDEVVMDLQYRGQDYSLTNYDYWFHMVTKGITKMNIFNLRTSNVAYLEVGSTNIIELPSDYIDYVQVGVVNNQGVFHSLTLDSNIMPYPHETCGADDSAVLTAENAATPTLFGYGSSFVLWGGYLSTPYNLTGGYNVGYYNIDRQNNRLLVSGLPQGTAVVVEYKTSGVRINGVTMIRQQMNEALLSWCMMEAQKYGVIQSQTNWASVYFGDENELESLDQAITMDEFKDILYGTWKQSPKR